MRTSLTSYARSPRVPAILAAGLAWSVALSPLPAEAATTAVSTATSSAAAPTPRPWGPYYATNRRAEAVGTITVLPASLQPWEIPYAKAVRIDGEFRDLTSPAVTLVDTCARVRFRFTYSPDFSSYENFFTCKFLTPKEIDLLKWGTVRQVEMQICAEPLTMKASKCFTTDNWQTLYIAR